MFTSSFAKNIYCKYVLLKFQMKRLVIEGLVSMLCKGQKLPAPIKYSAKDRLDGVGHYPIKFKSENRRKCMCHKVARKTSTFCVKCNVALCIDTPCWSLWHTEKDYLYDDTSLSAKVAYRKIVKF